MRASGPISVEHAIFRLLLNPPSGACFSAPFVFPNIGNVAHFFPLHALHLDLTFWVVPVVLTFRPSQGKLTTAVYRRDKQGRVRLNGGYRF